MGHFDKISGLALATALAAWMWLLIPCAHAQPTARKSYVLRGTVEQVDPTSKRLTVANEPIQGGMGAMTMTYGVDDPAILNRLKAGDRITAQMFDGDSTLYEVKVVSQPAAAPVQAQQNGMRLDDLERMAVGE